MLFLKPKLKLNQRGTVVKRTQLWYKNTEWLFDSNSFKFKLFDHDVIFQRVDWGFLYVYDLTEGRIVWHRIEYLPVICPDKADFINVDDVFLTIDHEPVKVLGLLENTMTDNNIDVCSCFNNQDRYLISKKDLLKRYKIPEHIFP